MNAETASQYLTNSKKVIFALDSKGVRRRVCRITLISAYHAEVEPLDGGARFISTEFMTRTRKDKGGRPRNYLGK